METAPTTEAIEKLLADGSFAELRRVFDALSAVEAAEVLHHLDPTARAVAFRFLARHQAADLFKLLPMHDQVTLIHALGREEAAEALNQMAPDDRTALLEEMPGEITRRLMGLLSPKELETARALLGYPEESVGRLMTPRCVEIRPEWTIAETLAYIRDHGHHAENLSTLYIVDEDGRLLDDIRVRRILLAQPETTIAEVMDGNFEALRATDDQEEAIAAFRQSHRVTMPVVDSEGILLGIVTLDDVTEVIEELATHDMQKMGGQEALELPYLATPLATMVKKRAGWLILLFVGEMLTATAMGYFEKEIERAVVLALFVPLIISSGGNSGSQGASLIIRALALGEVGIRDWFRVMRRELASGLALGFVLGFIGFLRISIWSSFSGIYGPHWLLIATTVWVSLVGVVCWGTIAGALMPILMERLGADPATSSAPFVATLVDVTGLVIYFSVAAVILRGVML